MCYARVMVAYTFLRSDARDKEAGGGAYINKLAGALRRAGHDVAMGDDTAPDRIVVVDGLALASVAPGVVAGLTNAVALVHYVPRDDDAPLRMFRRIVATSEAVAAGLMERCGIPPDQVTVVTPGVAEAVRSAGRSAGSGACEILSIGALVPRKDHATLITALNRLSDLDWRLTIVGDTQRDPANTAALRALANGDRVRFAGVLDDAGLEALWHGADLFALATRWEGYAAAVAEALRHGVPVAVTKPASALVTPQTGIVCDAGDVEQFSKAVRRLIYDITLRSQLAEAAWRAGQALPSWAEQAARFAAVTT